ncbi:MAG: ATP-binding cassette domain-containing protein [Bacteroidia bacterium]|nr:ATP-binding cassette domain-containing protein [Bacteroidia bacterium]
MLTSLTIKNLSKRFENNIIFNNTSISIQNTNSIVFLGENGSGKSTLLKILCGYLYYDTGEIFWNEKENSINNFAVSAPYIELFEQLTVKEHLKFHFNFHNRIQNITDDKILEISNLDQHKNKQVKKLSSGLKQRLKNVLAIFSDTQVLFFDEPCSNLDEYNIELYQKLVREYTSEKLLIIASNQKHEYDYLSPAIFKIENSKLIQI